MTGGDGVRRLGALLTLIHGTSTDDVRLITKRSVTRLLAERGCSERNCVRVTAVPWEHTERYGVLRRLGISVGSGRAPGDIGQAVAKSLSSTSEPLTFVVNEAQSADSVSLFALSSAVHRLPDTPLTVIVAGTWSEDDVTFAALRQAHRDSVVGIDSLDDEGVLELAASLGVSLEPWAVRRLRRHTNGSPSAIAELLCDAEPVHWLSPDSRMPATPSARARARHLLSLVDDEVTGIVEACAVIGRWATVELLGTLAQVGDPLPAIDVAREVGLLEIRDSKNRLLVGFPSRMCRAALYETTGLTRRRDLHRVAADAVDDESESFRHRVRASSAPHEALATDLDQFAKRCANLGSWQLAGDALVSSSRLSVDAPQAERRLLQAADAFVGSGDLASMAGLSPELNEAPASPERDGVLGYQELILGHRAEADHRLRNAWNRCTVREPQTAAKICHRLALHALADWECDEVIHWSGQASELVNTAVPAALEALTLRGLGLAGAGRIDEALLAYAQVTNQVKVGAQAQRATMGQGWLHFALDDLLRAARELESAAPLSPWRGSSRISLWANGWLARAQLYLGDWNAAMAAVQRAMAILEETGQELLAPLIHWTGAEIAALRGQTALADQHVAAASVFRTEYRTMLVASVMARASVALCRADYPGVLRAFEPLLTGRSMSALDEPGFWPWHDTYAIALVAIGQVAEADEFLVPYEARAAASQHRSTMARLMSVRARVQAAQGEIEVAKETFTRAITLVSSMPMPYLQARIHYAFGQTLRRAGKRREADRELNRAREGYVTLGASAYVVRCDRELKAGSRGKATAGVGGFECELTNQERSVVELVARGMTNKEVASSLFLSVKTVQYHLTRVYARLGIRSRSELAAMYYTSAHEQVLTKN